MSASLESSCVKFGSEALDKPRILGPQERLQECTSGLLTAGSVIARRFPYKVGV
jgi:hypothetical protein